MSSKSPDELLASAIESSRSVKFGKGIVSKTSVVAGIAMMVLLAVAWRWNGTLSENLGLLVVASAALAFAVWYIRSTQSFAEKNPALALLDGAELLEWQRMETAAKGLPPAVDDPPRELPKVTDRDG